MKLHEVCVYWLVGYRLGTKVEKRDHGPIITISVSPLFMASFLGDPFKVKINISGQGRVELARATMKICRLVLLIAWLLSLSIDFVRGI